jgi:hypothetical protein
MHKVKNSIIAVFIFSGIFCFVEVLQAVTINAASPSYSDVASAVSSANSGDTVIVPSGSATWNSVLTITKGIIFQGAGIDNTTITGNVGSSSYLVRYEPSSPALNEAFRMTGFTFDFNGNCLAFNLRNTTTVNALTKIRIDHNEFLNCIIHPTILINGPIYGVVDNNTWTGSVHFDNYGQSSLGDWSDQPFSFGSANNFYYEDNTFTSDCGGCTGGHGGRYVFRYNTYTYNNPSQGLFPWFDMHGNQNNLNCNSMCPRGGELYGNIVTDNPPTSSGRMVDHRGGQMLVFFNKMVGFGSTDFQVREEYCDSVCSPIYTMHVNNSYYWNNRDDTNLFSPSINQNTCGEYQIAENVDFWAHKASFNGTVGMGCGPLASMPATCTTGVGYWATDQSCSSVDSANVGAHPATPISGTLYKCTSPNTWTAYFTPYTYPHPLVTGEDPPPPPPPPDTTPPTDIATVNDGTGNDMDLTSPTTELSANWTPSTDDESSISKYWYAIGTTAGGTDTAEWTFTTNGTVTSVTRSGLSLTIGVTYYFTVKAENGVSLQSNPTSSDGRVVLLGLDGEPPVISNVKAINIMKTGATITWDTDEPATSRVEYGATASYGNSTVEDGNFMTGHSVNLTDLVPGIEYHYRVVSKDSLDNEKISVEYKFTTLGEDKIDVKAYPNPLVVSEGSQITFSVSSATGGEVKIYTISGKLVKKLLIASGDSEVNWDVLNEEGNSITAGLYIYSITDAEGNKKTGKLAIGN